uniref:Calcineurin-like phosphoesterase domain-containing protein n=1 Tax=Ditylenchus dipsaci TaxID=166011 RepID=A0A915DBQ5_9BILA
MKWKFWAAIIACAQLAFVGARCLSTGTLHAQLSHLHSLVNLQFIFALLDLVVYPRLLLLRCKNHQLVNDLEKGTWIIFIGLTHLACLFFFVGLPDQHSWLAVLSFVCLGLYEHLAIFFIICKALEWLLDLICPKTTNFVLKSKKLHTLIAVVLALGLTIDGFITATSNPQVSNIDISLPKGASNLDGFTIALLTDVHIGPTVGKQRLQNIVNIVNGLDADVIAIVGDLIDGFLGNLGEKALILKKLKSRHGTFFVTGNHEYYHSSIDEWISFFKHKLNMTILRNENFLINQNICLAGVDDVVTQRLFIDGHRMDAEKAIQNCPAKSYVVMMVHQPNAARKILDMSSRHINLILSGHTHGGQFYIFWPISYLYHAFLHGHYKYGKLGTDIVVSAGVNYWGPPAKMRNLCEIVRIKLVSNV